VTARGGDGRPRRLIVTGDDFGLAPEVNRAIALAHRDGILTSASLMVAGPAAREAVQIADELPTLAVGLHLVLVQGRATSSSADLPGLVDTAGAFRESVVPAALLYFFRPSLRGALRREIRAQLDAYRATGLPLDHVDGHLNIHLHPVVQSLLFELAREYAIPAIRLTRDPIVRNLRYDSRNPVRKVFEGVAFRALSRVAARRFGALGVVSADHLFGLHQSGGCDARYLRHVLAALPPGDSEIYCHPAERQTPEMRRAMPGYRPADELAALLDPAVLAELEQRSIRLVRYRDLRG
jgi:hopanoid biosynthesis associated protein HpnK